MRRTFIVGGIVVWACVIAAGSAGADPLTFSYDHVVLDIPAAPRAQVVTPQTQPLKLVADVDPATGNFTVQPSDWQFPTYQLTSPVPGTINVNLNGPATGNLNFASGQLSFNGDFLATVTLSGYGDCTVDTGTLGLTTSATSPLSGQAFPPGQTGALTGDGAFGGGWNTLAPGSGPACSLVDSVLHGPGGIWISRGISPDPPRLALYARRPVSAKAGTLVTIKATVSDLGGNDKSPIKVCLAAPRLLQPRHSCKAVPSLTSGQAKTVTFRVKSLTKRPGKYTLNLSATGSAIKTIKRSLTLKVD